MSKCFLTKSWESTKQDPSPAVRDDKRGAIAEDLPPILERVGITRAAWLQLAKDFETTFCTWIGQAGHVERVCGRGGQRWARGIRACRRLFPS